MSAICRLSRSNTVHYMSCVEILCICILFTESSTIVAGPEGNERQQSACAVGQKIVSLTQAAGILHDRFPRTSGLLSEVRIIGIFAVISILGYPPSMASILSGVGCTGH